jgi:uncharacterized repeat protein (TIGR04076 family)
MAGKQVLITVYKQKGKCAAKHKKGQKFIYKGTLPKICPSAWNSIYPYVRVLSFGGNLPWEKEGEAYIACPDHKNPVVFKLTRIERKNR